jgi:hypothetical protein
MILLIDYKASFLYSLYSPFPRGIVLERVSCDLQIQRLGVLKLPGTFSQQRRCSVSMRLSSKSPITLFRKKLTM